MSKQKWIRQEALRWHEEEIITTEQYQQIVARYPEPNRASSLPIFGGMLLGLGVLTFVASNWQGMSQPVKLLIIIFSMVFAYAAGEWLRRRTYEVLGMAFTLLGVLIYGAGFFLIGQMYHLSGNPLGAFYMWFVGAGLIAWHYRSKALTLVSLLILTAAFWYGLVTDSRHGLATLYLYLLFLLGLVPLLYRFRSLGLTAASVILLQVMLTTDLIQWGNEGMAQLGSLVLLVLAVSLPRWTEPFPRLLRLVSYLSTTFVAFVFILTNYIYKWAPTYFDRFTVGLTIVLLLLFIYLHWRRNEPDRWWDVLPYLPLLLGFFVSSWQSVQNITLLIALFIFTIAIGVNGERNRDISQINTGTVLFGLTCFVAYINFAWDFMDKSLFFFLSGALLLLLSLILERQRRKWVQSARRENGE